MKNIRYSFTFLVAFLLLVMTLLRFTSTEMLTQYAARSRATCNMLFFVVSFLCYGYYILLRRRCGHLAGDIFWPIVGTGLLLRGIVVHFSIKIFGITALSPYIYTPIHAICLLLLLSFIIANTAISVNCFVKPKEQIPYLVIHGAKTGSIVLNGRVDAAIEYLKANNSTVAIASGGKGSTENDSEAHYISERMAKADIPGERVIMEDRSTTTYENLLYSKELMPEKPDFAVVTDDYHILRARLIAKKVFGYYPQGLPSHSSRVSLPHYVLREYYSLLYNYLHQRL